MYPIAQQGGAAFGQGMPSGLDPGIWEDFQKAVTAGPFNTDSNTLVGGGALRTESLEHTLMSVVQTVDHFKLFNRLKKTAATATVDEWTEHDDVGGRRGGAFNTELGDIQSSTGSYKRKTLAIKYLMTRREVSVVQSMQGSIISAESQEQVNGTLELLTSAEWAMFYGDASVVAEEFDGLEALLRPETDQVIDVGGLPMDNQGFQHVLQGASTIAGLGGFGNPTDLFLSYAAQTDMDLKLDPAFRVPLTSVGAGGIMQGAPVNGVRTSFGDIKNNPDVFIQEGEMPPEVKGTNTTVDPTKPTSVTVTTPPDVSSKFALGHAGNYDWGVTSVNSHGESDMTFVGSTPVAAGDKAILTITKNGIDATGYKIYRSRKDGTSLPTDMRFMIRIPAAPGSGSQTLHDDLNGDIPGTSLGFILNLNPALDAIGFRQYMPMTRFPLYPTLRASIPWAQLLFGALRVSKLKQHVMLKNILPIRTKALWDPFG